MNLAELTEFIKSLPGPRLVILNTVQNAAVTANELKDRKEDIIHLSTALAPVHRRKIVDRIKSRLAQPGDSEWTLVATSCVEAGVDFSFRSAVRESCSVASIIQTGGRTNREAVWKVCEVWDVRLQDCLFNHHPAFEGSRMVLREMFEVGFLDGRTPAEAVTEAIRLEIMRRFRQETQELMRRERLLDFPGVEDLYEVIAGDTRTVVVVEDLAQKLERRERVDSRELLLGSVQMWATKVDQWAVLGFDGYPELYKWTARYDSEFLGYMEGVMPLVLAGKGGGYFA